MSTILISLAAAVAPSWIELSPAAAASPRLPAGGEAAIGAQIAALGNKLNALDERYNQQALVVAGLQQRLDSNRAALRADAARVVHLRSLVRSEAVLDFMDQGQGGNVGADGGGTVAAASSGEATASTLRTGFLGAVSTGQAKTVHSLERLQQLLATQGSKVAAERLAALSAMSQLGQDRAVTQRAAAAEKALLATAQGRLAALAAQKQALAQARTTEASLSKVATVSGVSGVSGASVQLSPQAAPAPAPAPAAPAPAAPTPVAPSPAQGAPTAPSASTVVALAQAQLGKPYVWAAAGPNSFDCSGLVMFVYAHLGISLSHSAQAQYDASTPVSMAQAQPGDLVFFGSGPSGITHVGIYVGGGQMIDAPYSGAVVRYDSVAWGGLVGFGRVA